MIPINKIYYLQSSLVKWEQNDEDLVQTLSLMLKFKHAQRKLSKRFSSLTKCMWFLEFKP